MKILNKLNKNQEGFTLLELLVVVGIIAIIGGAMISSFAGNEVKAARGVATQTIAGIESAVRVFTVETKRLPNNLESLVCAPYSSAGDVASIAWGTNAVNDPKAADAVISGGGVITTALKFGGESNVAGIGGGMSKKLAEKFIGYKLTADQAEGLNNLGMSSLRYAMSEACDTDVATTATLTGVNGATGPMGASAKGLVGIDIPNQAFADPRPDGTTGFKLRGVGFAGLIATGTPVLRWYKGSADGATINNGYNNLKVGAAEDDILIALGIGQDTDLIGTTLDAKMSKAPFYGQVGKDKYAHYIGLFNITDENNIQLQSVVDARGDFLDEEIAEFQGQKT
jgi:prepilin-type N-terminal cleavage/methylation domain-containing protein